jgi:NADH:ubiquinone oxidoreductase subunit 2 (subunit N)
MALGLVALAGLAPYLDRFDPDEPTASSGLAWTAFFAPPLAMTVTMEILPTLGARQAAVFATVCISLGLVNLAWGVLGAWRAPTLTSAWRRSFLADWGLVLMGFGLLVPSGRGLAGAFVCLLSLVLCRLPLSIYARSSLEEGTSSGNQTEGVGDPSSSGSLGPSVRFSSARNLLVGLALAGAAPFAGFAGRLLLLDAAMQLAWPLALLLVVAMVGWLAHSFRLGAGLGRPQGWTAAGVGIVLAIGGFIGILPGLVLAIAGFGSFQL